MKCFELSWTKCHIVNQQEIIQDTNNCILLLFFLEKNQNILQVT